VRKLIPCSVDSRLVGFSWTPNQTAEFQTVASELSDCALVFQCSHL